MLSALLVLLMGVQLDPGAGPDRDARALPLSVYHGNWRVIAADDKSQQATMRIDIQHSPGEREGTGSYALFQPFCDLTAGMKITGTADCELIGQGGELAVRADARRMTVIFMPTADGIEHRLRFRRSGREMTGSYEVADYRRRVRLERVPD